MQDAKLFRLIYVSKNEILGDETHIIQEISKIFAASRSRNQHLGLTGALVFNSGYFAQVLEGPEQEVRKQFDHIKQDARHSEVMSLVEDFIESRQFAEWSMAYSGSDPEFATRFSECLGGIEPQSDLHQNLIFSVLQEQVRELESRGVNS